MTGYIYCLVNASIPGLVKIGKTKRNPHERAAEISASTGVPTPFEIKWSRQVADMDKAESDLHAALLGCRLSKRREFFRCTPAQAMSAAKALHSFALVKGNQKPSRQAARQNSKTPAKQRRRYDVSMGFSLTVATVAIFGGAVAFDLDASTVATATAGIGLALTVLFQSAPLIGALRG
jgi:hypothetical protein